MSGYILAKYEQIGISVERMVTLLQGGSPRQLIERGPIYLARQLPEILYIAKGREHYLEELRVTVLTYQFADSTHGIQDVDFASFFVPPRSAYTRRSPGCSTPRCARIS